MGWGNSGSEYAGWDMARTNQNPFYNPYMSHVDWGGGVAAIYGLMKQKQDEDFQKQQILGQQEFNRQLQTKQEQRLEDQAKQQQAQSQATIRRENLQSDVAQKQLAPFSVPRESISALYGELQKAGIPGASVVAAAIPKMADADLEQAWTNGQGYMSMLGKQREQQQAILERQQQLESQAKLRASQWKITRATQLIATPLKGLYAERDAIMKDSKIDQQALLTGQDPDILRQKKLAKIQPLIENYEAALGHVQGAAGTLTPDNPDISRDDDDILSSVIKNPRGVFTGELFKGAAMPEGREAETGLPLRNIPRTPTQTQTGAKPSPAQTRIVKGQTYYKHKDGKWYLTPETPASQTTS